MMPHGLRLLYTGKGAYLYMKKLIVLCGVDSRMEATLAELRYQHPRIFLVANRSHLHHVASSSVGSRTHTPDNGVFVFHMR